MRAGTLRERITVQAQAAVDDGQGGEARGPWTDVVGLVRIPARVTPLGGTERVVAMQVAPGVTHEVEVRNRAGITAAMRAVWHARHGDRVLYFTAPGAPTPKNVGLVFMAREDAA